MPASLSDDEFSRTLCWIREVVPSTDPIAIVGTNKQITVPLEEAYDIAVRLYQYEPRKMPKIISILCGILHKEPSHADARVMLGLIAHRFRKHAEAVELLKEALRYNNVDAAYFYNLGNAYFAMGEYEEALASLERAVDLDEALFEAYDVMGKIYRERKDYEKALSYFERSFAIHGQAVWTKAYIAECLFRSGKISEALTNIEACIDKFLYIRANELASGEMIWPWCARLYSSRKAKFMLDRYKATNC